MEIYRKQMDKKILEHLKDIIQTYLKSKGFKNANFIRENLDKVAGLYVENLTGRYGANMQSRGKTASRDDEIVIDKKFVRLDENGEPIEIDKNVEKLIMTQLTHELVHSGARFDGHTGINYIHQNTGLNEGMTQMFNIDI